MSADLIEAASDRVGACSATFNNCEALATGSCVLTTPTPATIWEAPERGGSLMTNSPVASARGLHWQLPPLRKLQVSAAVSPVNTKCFRVDAKSGPTIRS